MEMFIPVLLILWVVTIIYFNRLLAKKDKRIEFANEHVGRLEESSTFKLNAIEELNNKINSLQFNLDKEIEKNRVVISQKKSSETRLGQISEHLVPFLAEFPYSPGDCKFLGMPLDYIVFDFDDNKIVFLEIKTGNSVESQRQKQLKNMIKTGRVFYDKLTINQKGVKIKTEENDK